jgi:hypothetical protein
MMAALIRTLGQNRAYEAVDLILTLSIVVTALLIGLLVLSLVQGRRLRRERARTSRQICSHLLRVLKLSVREQHLAARLCALVGDPGWRHAVLMDPQAFALCAARLAEQGGADKAELEALRETLRLEPGEDEIVSSSSQLRPGLPIVASQGGEARIRGRVVSQTADSLRVQLAPDSAPALAGIPVRVFFQNRSGVFSFPSRVLERKGMELQLEHSEEVKHYQRRKDSRRQVQLPIFARPYGENAEALESTVMNLSGGGASLANPGQRFSPGDLVELSFAPSGDELAVPARVVRTSRTGALLHVRFESLSPAIRDHIARAIL